MRIKAVQFGELLGQLTPAMVTALCATVPTGMRDQIGPTRLRCATS
jgi:hypothetical protein